MSLARVRDLTRLELIGETLRHALNAIAQVVGGYSNPGIAKALYLSEHTVKTYGRGILNKLLVNDRVQAAVVALRSGLIK
jgi:DNA-binding NarL/FixJ family response regulator